jgi:HSP20 family molecular chaperone IbpA
MHTEKTSTMNIPVRVRKVESLSAELDRMEQRLRQRAYERFESRGNGGGQELDDWLAAEQDLIWKPSIEITEKGSQLVVDIELPGVQARDLDLRATPDQFLVRARTSHTQLEQRGAMHINERRSGEVFRAVDLPKSIDPDRVVAQYEHGLLHVVAAIRAALPERKDTAAA